MHWNWIRKGSAQMALTGDFLHPPFVASGCQPKNGRTVNSDQALRGRLGDEVYGRILDLYADGSADEDSGRYDQALANYTQILKLLPFPQGQWETCTLTLVAIADV